MKGEQYPVAVADQEFAVATPRVSSGVIFSDDQSRILMLRSAYQIYWEIPGGDVKPGESPYAAAWREVREKLGVDVPVGRMLGVDWEPGDAEDDKLLFLFEGSRLPADTAFPFTDGGVTEARYVPAGELESYTVARLARRVRAALRDVPAAYFEYGEPGIPLAT